MRAHRIALVAAALVTAAACAAPATAQAGWRINRAAMIASVVWHSPCPWTLAWAQPPEVAGAFGEPMAWASMQDGCRRQGHGTVFVNVDEPVHTFDVFCTRVLHEVGHLAGAVHVANSRSVMYGQDETVEGRVRVRGRWVWTGDGDPRCRDRGRPYLEAHGLLRPRVTGSRVPRY